MIAVHVRHGDFINGGIQYPTEAYAHVLRRLVEITGATTIFVGSDDDRVYKDLPAFMYGDYKTTGPNLTFAHIPREIAGVLYDASNPERSDLLLSQQGKLGLALSAQMLLFSMSQSFLGTRVSQQGLMGQQRATYACEDDSCCEHTRIC